MTPGFPDSSAARVSGAYELADPVQAVPRGHPTLRGHVRIMRIDHWTKNVFVLPGVVAAVTLTDAHFGVGGLPRLLLGLLAVGLVASSNYTINEVLDAPFDAHHPSKRSRPVPSGQVNIPLAYIQWIVLGVAGVALGWTIGARFTAALVALWVMGCVYNIRPARSKDVPYVDVLTEAINNPIRMMAGWYVFAATIVPPATMLLGYWMVGCYFMAIKRYAEGRELADVGRLTAYRRSLAYFTPERMMIAIMFYCAAAMLFFGAFIIRYRLELVLSFPFVALVMATYLELGFRHDSAAQNPEKLYREQKLMAAVVSCTVVMLVLMYVDLPVLHTMIDPSFLGGVRPAQ
jgi:decaprenyl-phosphate phosphoribosyltransferase